MSTPRADTLQDLHDLNRYTNWLLNGHTPQPGKPDQLTIIPITELLRRDEHTNTRDGYPTGTGQGAQGGDTPNPTHNAAQANVDHERCEADQIRIILTGLTEHIAEARLHLTAAITRNNLIHRTQTTTRHSNEPTACKACDRIVQCTEADPIRKGYCSACRTAWARYSQTQLEAGNQPDRAMFEHHRRSPAA